jgi:hypothetical protein
MPAAAANRSGTVNSPPAFGGGGKNKSENLNKLCLLY